MKKLVLIVLAVLIPTTLTLTARAQTADSAADKEYKLLPGLAKDVMDTNADPCVNFFQYACGNFSKLYPIPADRSSFESFLMMQDHTEHVLHTMLEKAAAGGAQRTANEQKIGDYYASCMDSDAINAKGFKVLQPELDRIAALKDKSELTSLLAHFQLINVNAFLGFGEQQDFKDATKQIASVDQGGMGLPERDYYFRTGDVAEKTRKDYVQHVTNMLKLLGEPDSQAASDAQSIMKLETALATVSMDVTSRRDPQNIYHLLPVSDLQKLTPAMNWNEFLRESDAPPVTELNVVNPKFFIGLNVLINATDIKTIQAYLRWQLIHSTDSLVLPKAVDDEVFDFYRHKLRGQPEQRARWKRCVATTDNAIGEALGQVYVAQEFPPSSKQATVQMVHDIETAMDQDISTLNWMSAETKVRAKEKLHMVADKIGYPDKWRDYSKLVVERDDAFGNDQRAIVFENLREIHKIGTPVDRGEWGMTPPTINAYYNSLMNDINFPAGILQKPFYDPNSTDAENYGHIGAVVGHELTHGFDDQGRQFDGKGNLSDWWTPEDAKKFEEKADCEVREYGSFVAVDDVHVNGKLTLGENTADNGGLRLAYMALLEDAKRKGIDVNQKQDGFTPLQQFFIGFGQDWCGESRPEMQRLQVQTNEHAPREFRVMGVVQNMHEFGEAFGCKVGQPMMPQNSCRVW
jgi:endothelin-converting enzyme/putative endopeptidase